MRPCALAAFALVASACAAHQANRPCPDPVALRKQVARTLLGYREWTLASQPLRELVISRPDDADVRAMLGTAYRELGLYAESEAEYRTASRLDPKQAEAYEGLGLLGFQRGDSGEAALVYLRRALDLQPENAAYYNNLGFALYLRHRYAEAEAAFREGLRRDPSMRRLRNNLGFTYAQQGNVKAAGREFERTGSPAAVENNLGFALERSGEAVQACRRYQEAQRLDPLLVVASNNVERVCPGESPGSPRSDP